MAEALVESDANTLARPLKVLVELIQNDIQAAREAAEHAGLPYYQAAGEKMLEAKTQLEHGEFMPWIERHFKISYSHAKKYMQLATAAGGEKAFTKSFSSLSEFIRKETGSTSYNMPHTVRPKDWHEPVNEIINRVDTETLNLRREQLKRADEREAQRLLALQLIDIGYKVLARTLHPDKKTGSREAMTRLNAVRDRLKLQC